MPAPSAEEGVSGLFHQVGHFRRLGGHGQGARLDAPGIQQIADQAPHVIGLLVDDVEELEHLGRLQRRGGAQHGCRRALDGSQGSAQFVDHQAQELGPRSFQLLQVRPRLLLGSMGARVGDRRRRLRREQDQDLFVLAGELAPAFFLGQKEIADMDAPVMQRGSLEDLPPDPFRGKAKGSNIARQVSKSKHSRQVPEVCEQLQSVGPVRELAVLLRGQAGTDDILNLPGVVNSGHDPVAGAGEFAGAFHGLAQDGSEVKAGVDAQACRAQLGDAVPQSLVFSFRCVGVGQWPILRRRRTRPGTAAVWQDASGGWSRVQPLRRRQ